MEKSFSYNHTIISYRTEGEGKPVVLLHGFGEDSHIWDKQVAFLKQHCLLIVPDLPGSGKSGLLEKAKSKSQKLKVEGGSESDDDYISIEDYADCIHALLLHENILHCTMLGHSMGGYITLAFAEKYPLLLTGFGLVHSTAFADNEEKKKNRERSIELIESYGGYAFLKTTIPNLFGAQFKEAYPEQVATLIKASKNFTNKALQQYTLAMMRRPDRTNVLKSNPLPVLFVIGTEDVAAPMADLMQQTPLPLISYIHVLQHTGHMGMWEVTGQMNDILLDFINRP